MTLKSLCLLLLVSTGCAEMSESAWHPVPATISTASISDPAEDMKALVNMQSFPPILVDVSTKYIKEVWAQGGTRVLSFAQVSELRLVNHDDKYRVFAYDVNGKLIFDFAPRDRDRATCEQFLSTFYALTKRTPPRPVAELGERSATR